MVPNEDEGREKIRRDQDLILGTSGGAAGGRSGDRADPDASWRILGFMGSLLAVIGFADILLNLYPPAFDSPEWEFATVARMLTSLPLPTVGFAALMAWCFVRGSRTAQITMAVFASAVVVLIGAAYVLFLFNVPLAWSATSGPQGPVITRTIVRTSVMAVGFGIGYLVAAIALLRTHTPRART